MKTEFKTLEHLKASKLDQHYGTEEFYRANMFVKKVIHTEGIKELADQAQCYWLLDILATEFYDALKSQKQEPDKFYITIESKDDQADITMKNYRDKVIYKRHIDYTDLPTGKLMIYAGWQGEEGYLVLCLPTED
jgi:hypothetical protein